MDAEPRYCQRCAREVEPGDAYCAGCGTAVPRMADKPEPFPVAPTEDERREEAKAKAIADLKAGWWKTLIALLVVLYLFYAWIG